MASSPGTFGRSDASCSAGDTAPVDGTRTPRRIQWVGKDTGDDPEASPRERIRELDEMGLDPNAFETLRNALEGRRSGEHLPSQSRLLGGKTRTLPPIPLRAAVSRHTTTSIPMSPQTPVAGSNVRLSDPSPPHIDSDNPYPISTPQVQFESKGTGSSTRASLAVDDRSRLSSSTLVAQRTHDVPGEVWIDPLEREGLPINASVHNTGNGGGTGNALRRRSTWSRRNRHDDVISGERHIERLAEHQAVGVVRAHTRRGLRWIHRPPNGNVGKSQGVQDEEKVKQDQAREGTNRKGKETKHTHHFLRRHVHSDTENNTDFAGGEFRRPGRVRKGVPGSWFAPVTHLSHMHTRPVPQNHSGGHSPARSHGPKLGNGVLGALLALYGHDEHDDEGSTSGASSRTSSDAGSEVDVLPKPNCPWLPEQDDDHQGKHDLGRSMKGGSASSILSHFRTPFLPAASTTAALIAGAGALSGAAAPQQATLAPNLKRPGYNLVRYSVEEVPKVAAKASHGVSLDLRYGTDSGTSTTDRHVDKDKDSEAETPETPGATIIGSPTLGSEGLVDRTQEGRDHPDSTTGGRRRKGWTGILKDLPLAMHLSPGVLTPYHSGAHTSGGSGTPTPGTSSPGDTPMDEFGGKKDYFDRKHIEQEKWRFREQERKERREREKHKAKEKRLKRKKAEVYITKHVAEILQRQEFIMKLARAMMMFGGPSHRLASQIQSTGHVLDLELSCMYLPDMMLISFEDSTTGTSNVKFIRQGSALDLEKLGDAYTLYWSVIHDDMSVSAASAALDVLMRKKPLYSFMQLVIVGGMCSASICSVSFSGSFIDSLVSAPLGALLVAVQLIGVRNELYAHVFEITIATLLSFLSAALASTNRFCYSAVASSAVVLILPGFIVLSGSLELSSRSMVAGAVRLCFALMYSLFLGFGLAIGAELYESILRRSILHPTDLTCQNSHDPTGPWWQQTPKMWWAFLTVPMYSLFLSMRLMAPLWRKEMLLLVAISCIGWVTNHFVSVRFPNQSDISATVGAFAVGFVSNMYGRFFDGNAFVVMITGILFQVPSGLANGGLLNFVSAQAAGSSSNSSYLNGFQTALQLISVAIGLTVGLAISLVIVHPVPSRRRAGGMFSL